MKTIVITTQSEIDALPASFDQFTVIEIRSTEMICVRQTWGNSRVEAWGNSRVVARENSRVVAWENSSVEAWENSSVEAWGNSRVEAWGNSRVEAWGNSRVVARENSRVEAWENSSVEAWGNSRVEAWGNSRVVAWGNSRVDLFLCATVFVYSVAVTIRSLRDNSRLVYKKENCRRPDVFEGSPTIVEFEELITPTFEQWLERGYVVADGITQKLVSQKTLGEVTILEVTDHFEKEKSFVAKIGNKFAHGKTIEEAKNDLRYKLSDRDTSRYEAWAIDKVVPVDEMIEAYMTISGACSFGTKQFCESIKMKDHYSPKEIIDLTVGKYGNQQFAAFWS